MALCNLLLFGLLMYVHKRRGLLVVHSVNVALALALISACGDPLLSIPDRGGSSVGAGLASQYVDPAIQFSIRDTSLKVGDSSVVVLEDSLLLSQSRRRFFAPRIQWLSSDTNVVTVSESGIVRARAAGAASILAAADDRTGSRSVVIQMNEPPPAPDPEPPTPPAPQPPPPGSADLRLPADNPAELPRLQVELPVAEGGGTIRRVSAGQSIQAAVDAASPGDVILLAPGAIYEQAVTLRKKTGTGWITIRTDAAPTERGKRVSLADTVRFARIRAPGANQPTISTETAAAGYWLVNLDITVAPNATTLNTLVNLDTPNQNTLAKVPSRIVLDRVIVRGRPSLTLRRCISLQSAHTAIVSSLVIECHEKGYDSQAIAGWNGPGPYLIENNLLEGAGENIMFGGADPAIPGLVPSDITIRWNHIRKPAAWQQNKAWSIKNLFELKNAARLLLNHNVFDGNWADAQGGTGILVWSANQSGTAPWSGSVDITFAHNVLRNMTSAIGLGGKQGVAVTTERVLLASNVIYRIGQDSDFGGDGRTIVIVQAVSNLHITDNTVIGAKHSALYLAPDGNPQGVNIRYSRNLTNFGTYGVIGKDWGVRAFSSMYTGFEFSNNCFFESAASAPALYPAPNTQTAELRLSLFSALRGHDVTPRTGSACANMLPDGNTVGADPGLVPLLENRAVAGLGTPNGS